VVVLPGFMVRWGRGGIPRRPTVEIAPRKKYDVVLFIDLLFFPWLYSCTVKIVRLAKEVLISDK